MQEPERQTNKQNKVTWKRFLYKEKKCEIKQNISLLLISLKRFFKKDIASMNQE